MQMSFVGYLGLLDTGLNIGIVCYDYKKRRRKKKDIITETQKRSVEGS